MGSIACGNVFCAPTSIALGIYGFIVLNDLEVKRAFERTARGQHPDPIRALVQR